MINVKVFHCEDENCGNVLPDAIGVVYLPARIDSNFKPVFLQDIVEVEDLVKKVLEKLPEPKDINDEEFDVIK